MSRRRFVAGTDSDHDQPIFPDRTRDLAVLDGPNPLWVADLTYVATAAGFVYVALIMDACLSRSLLSPGNGRFWVAMALRPRAAKAGLRIS